MSWFLNLTTAGKLGLGFGLMVVLLVVVTAIAYTGITGLHRSQEQLYSVEFHTAVDLKDVRANQNAMVAAVARMLLSTRRAQQDEWHQEIRQRAKENDETVERLLARHRADPVFAAKLSEFRTVQNAFKQMRDAELIPLVYDGKVEDAKKLLLGVQVEASARMRVLADELVDEAERRARVAVSTAGERASAATRAFAAAGVIALLASTALVAVLNRVIAVPLREVSAAAARVAAGDLTAGVAMREHTDEVGALSRSFQRMVEGLREVNREIRDGVNVLGAASAEILAGAAQVAAGAVETATAVNETTATVDEVKQTSELASQKARSVADSAQKAAQVSQAGRKAVENTAEGMQRIREQMESIAESIVRLSEQTQAIGDIIASVNDLAEQSNLLAVNAAIEAAKAGEQGRGFAVVAQEVKSLAEQSKQATAKVRAILGDIQKATSGAVMATEQGGKAVAAGVKQSADAGDAIRALADSIAEAAQAAAQIAASAQQQLVGMDQVASAMESIRQASAQNAASTKQAEAAAQNASELSQRLKGLVARYTV
ncbi:MAG: methyl-accepting chemotaxis protein [Candidatus Rokubacteria bacterium]|nr:methyl-accepting chemotaxis protein [Candidatus Rokubacteria bacterium]